MTKEQVIDKQMEAYNNRDIDSMMALFSDDIKMLNFPGNKILVDGSAECKKMYTELFSRSPKLYAEIINSIAIDNRVIVHEFISGRNGSPDKLEQVIIFEVKDEKITRVAIIRKDQNG